MSDGQLSAAERQRVLALIADPTRDEAKVFRFERLELGARDRRIVPLARTEHLFAAVQVLRAGGENRLHAHAHLDGFWFVLSGRVRFYTTNDEQLADLGPGEGVLIPRHYKYWFESVGDDVAELLQVEARDAPEPDAETFFA